MWAEIMLIVAMLSWIISAIIQTFRLNKYHEAIFEFRTIETNYKNVLADNKEFRKQHIHDIKFVNNTEEKLRIATNALDFVAKNKVEVETLNKYAKETLIDIENWKVRS